MILSIILLFFPICLINSLVIDLSKTQPDPKRDILCGENSASQKQWVGTETICLRCGDPKMSEDASIFLDANLVNLYFDENFVCLWRSKAKSPCGYMYTSFPALLYSNQLRIINVARAVHPLICSNTPGNTLKIIGNFDQMELVATCSPFKMINYNTKSVISKMSFVEYSLSPNQHLHSGCQVDCSLEVIQHYTDSSVGPPICKKFSLTDCQSCGACHKYSDTPSFQCLECDIKKSKYAQFTGDMVNNCKGFGVFYRGVPIVSNNAELLCSSSQDRTVMDPWIEFEYYLSPDKNPNKDCFSNFQCEGTYDDPFDDFIQILENIECKKELGKFFDFKLKINLLKGSREHYLLDRYVDDNNVNKYSFDNQDENQAFYKDRWLLRAFDLLKGTISINTAIMGEGPCSSLQKCFRNDEKAKIVWKSQLLSFWIVRKLHLSNILFDFSEMYPYASDGITVHSFHNKKKKCCTCDSAGICSKIESYANCECNPKAAHPRFLKPFAEYDKRIPGQSLPSTYEHFDFPHGLFNMKFVYDADIKSGAIPILEIQNCEFNDFYFHKLANSLTSIDRRGASVLIVVASTFKNNIFLHGYFTNSPQYYLRNNPFIYPPSDSSFFDVAQANFEITIEDSFFENFGVKRRLFRPASECNGCEMEHFHEGMVLFLVAFDGKIGLRRNTFNFMRKSNMYPEIKNDCMFQKLKDEKIPADRQSRVHIDKLIYSYMETRESKWDVGTSSIIQIRHMLRGISLYGNTFEGNVGLTGTGIFIFMFTHRVKNSPIPIIIKGNYFKRNSALQFGHSIVIFNNDVDYYTLNFLVKNRGIIVTGNSFTHNAGCFQSYGNVIIALSPFKIARLYDVDKSERYTDQELFGYNFYYGEFSNASPNLIAITDLFKNNIIDHITEKVDGTNSEFDPEKTVVNMQACTIQGNIFENNLALISNSIFLQGCPRVYFDSNSVINNSIPIPEYLSEGVYTNSGYYLNVKPFNFDPKDISGGPFPDSVGINYFPEEKVISTTSTPVIFHLTPLIRITNCMFKNNSMLYDNDLYLGAAITFESMIGGHYQIKGTVFRDHNGIGEGFRNVKNPTFLDNEAKYKALTTNPIITFSYLQSNFQGSLSFTTGNNDFKYSLLQNSIGRFINTVLEINYCAFEGNSFNLDPNLISLSSRKFKYPDVSLVRFYESEESCPYLPSNILKNSYVNEYCPYSPILSFSLKIYYNNISFNTILDQKVSEESFGAIIDMNYVNPAEYNIYDFQTIIGLSTFEANSGAAIFAVRYNYLRVIDESFQSTAYLKIFNIQVQNNSCPKAIISLREIIKFEINHIWGEQIYSRDGLIAIYNSVGKNSSSGLNIHGIVANRMFSTRAGCFSFFYCAYINLKEANCSNVIITPKEHFDSPALNSFSGCVLDHSGSNININIFSCKYVNIFKEAHGQETEPILSAPKATCFYFGSLTPILNEVSCISTSMSYNHLENSLIFGMYIMNTAFTLLNSAFQDNKPLLGVLFSTYSVGSVIKYTKFLRNSITKGSSVINIALQSNLTVFGSYFESNHCYECKGVLGIIEQSKVAIYDSIFRENLAQEGTAINCVMSYLSIYKTDFLKNQALLECSCIKLLMSSLLIFKANFQENSAIENAITVSKSLVNIRYCMFVDNNATRRSSNIYASECSIFEIYASEFLNNYWTISSRNTYGDFINTYESYVTLRFCKFTNGLADYGGAVYLFSNMFAFVIRDSLFINNTANLEGGAIYASGNISLIGSSGKNNTAWLQASFILIAKGFSAELDSIKLDFLQGKNIYLSGQSRISIAYTYLKAMTPYTVGTDCVGLYCLQCSFINVLSSYFISFRGALGAALVVSNMDSTAKTSLKVERSLFRFSRSEIGAAIYINGLSQVICESNIFQNNSVFKTSNNPNSGRGGAIYYDCTEKICFFNLTGNNTFFGNLADVAGGAHIFTNVSFTFGQNSNQYVDNQALYGPDRAGYAIKLIRIVDPPLELYESFIEAQSRLLQEEDVSGWILLPPPVFKLVDEFDQQVVHENSSLLTVAPGDNEAKDAIGFSHKTSFKAQKGLYIAYPLSVLKIPGSKYSLKFSSSAIAPNPNRPELTTSNVIPFGSYLRLCKRGEKLSANNACVTCPKNFYSIKEFLSSTDKASCLKCPPEAVCLGGDKIGPQPGYWRLSRDIHSFFPCQREDACLGADAGTGICTSLYNDKDGTFCETGWCAEGYQGNLCSDCVDGFAYEDKNSKRCVPCENNPYYYLRGFGIFLISFSIVVLTIRNSVIQIDERMKEHDTLVMTGEFVNKSENHKILQSIKENEESGTKREEEKAEERGDQEGDEEQDFSPIYLKILFSYLQIISVLGTFDFNWPITLQEFFKVSDTTVSSPKKFFSFDCLLKQSEFKKRGFRLFYTQLLLFAISPILFSVPTVIFWVLFFFVKYGSRMAAEQRRFKNYVSTSLVIILYIIHPNIVDTSFQAYSCKLLSDAEPGKEKWFLEADPEVECWGVNHIGWSMMVATPALLFWGAGIPFASIIALWRKKSMLDSEEVKSKLGFLYEGYKNEYFYWELIILYRKMLIVFSSVFLAAPGIQIQASFVLGVSIFCFLAQIFKNPYKDDVLNEMEKRALVASSFTLYSSLYFFTNISKPVEILIMLLDLVLNLYFLVFWAKEMFRQKSSELKRNKIIKFCCGKVLNFASKIKKFKVKAEEPKEIDPEEEEERILFEKDFNNIKTDKAGKEIICQVEELDKPDILKKIEAASNDNAQLFQSTEHKDKKKSVNFENQIDIMDTVK